MGGLREERFGGSGRAWRRRARDRGEWRRRARDRGEWRRRARDRGEWRTRARDGGVETGGSESGSVAKKKENKSTIGIGASLTPDLRDKKDSDTIMSNG